MSNCIFCKITKGEMPSWKVYENEHVYAFFDINPITRYHTLVIPKKHYISLFDIEEGELRELIAGVKAVAKLYEEKLGIQNVQVISNSGSEAQQDVFHLHFHLIPRQKGDGANIRWKTHPEYRKEFEEMLQELT